MVRFSLLSFLLVNQLSSFGEAAAFQVQSDVKVPPPISTREYKTYGNPVAVAPPPRLEEDEEDLFYQPPQYSNINQYSRQQQRSQYEQQPQYYRDEEEEEDDYYYNGASSAPANNFMSLEPNNDEFISSSRINTASLVGQGTGGNRVHPNANTNNGANYVRYRKERPVKKEACRHFQVDGFIDNTSGNNRMEYGMSYGGAHQDDRNNHPSKSYNPSDYMIVHRPTRQTSRQQPRRNNFSYQTNSVGEANAEPSNPARQFDPSRFEMAKPSAMRPPRYSNQKQNNSFGMEYGNSYGGNQVVDPAKEYNPNRYATVPRQQQQQPQRQQRQPQRQVPARPVRLTNQNRWQKEYDREANPDESNPANHFDPSKYALVRPQRNNNRSSRNNNLGMQYGNSYGGNEMGTNVNPAEQYNPNRYTAPAASAQAPARQDYGGTSSRQQEQDENSINNPADLYDPSRYVCAQPNLGRPHHNDQRQQQQQQYRNNPTIQQDSFTARQMQDPNSGVDWRPRYARASHVDRARPSSYDQGQYSRYSRSNRYTAPQQQQQQQQWQLSSGDQFAHTTTSSHGYTAGQYGYGNF